MFYVYPCIMRAYHYSCNALFPEARQHLPPKVESYTIFTTNISPISITESDNIYHKKLKVTQYFFTSAVVKPLHPIIWAVHQLNSIKPASTLMASSQYCMDDIMHEHQHRQDHPDDHHGQDRGVRLGRGRWSRLHRGLQHHLGGARSRRRLPDYPGRDYAMMTMMMAMMTMMMTDYPGDDYADHKDQHKHQYLQFDLINAKKREKKGYKNSGQIVVKSVKIEQVRMVKDDQRLNR